MASEFPDDRHRAAATALGAVALARQGAHEPALARIVRAEREHLADLDAELVALLLYERAWCERGLDRPAEAEVTYGRLLDASGTGELHRHGMLELAELEAAAERYEEAASRLRTLRTQLEAAPAAPDELRKQASYRLGVCEYRLDRFEVAAEQFESFLADFPDSDLEASARLLCGESHFKTGDHNRAARHLRTVVEKVDNAGIAALEVVGDPEGGGYVARVGLRGHGAVRIEGHWEGDVDTRREVDVALP